MSSSRRSAASTGQTPSAPLFGYSGNKEHNFDEMFDIFFEDGVLDDMNFSSAHEIDFSNQDDEDTDGMNHTEKNKSKNDFDKNERRERNREHAKRSRVRKKMIQESLQKSVDLLQDENNKLKAAILQYLGPDSLPSSDGGGQHPSSSTSLQSPSGPSSNSLGHPRSNTSSSLHYNLVKALQTAQQNFTITDPSLPDNPIIYASHGFLTLTGYALDQVLGRNCRFLQGAQTDPRAIDNIRHGLKNGLDSTTVILNYRYDGTPFWNQLFIGPLKDSHGNVVNYLGVQCKVSDLYAEAFLKTPNTSTLSVANIDAIYSSIMNAPTSTGTFLTSNFPAATSSNSSLNPLNNDITTATNPETDFGDDIFRASNLPFNDIFDSGPSQYNDNPPADSNIPTAVLSLDPVDDDSRSEGNHNPGNSHSPNKSKRSRDQL